MSSLPQDNVHGNNLWKGAHEVKLPCGTVLQLQGIASPTRTAFGRLVVQPNSSSSRRQGYHLTVRQVVQYMLDEIQQQRQEEEILVSAKELLSLGSVWRLMKEPQSTKKWKRTRLLSQHAGEKVPCCQGKQKEQSLRVHYRPSRFPAVHNAVDWTLPPSSNYTTTNNVNTTNNPRKPSAIRYYDSDFGYCVVHKPSGVPSHATVDNGVENVLYQLQQQQTTTTCSLPQRLDIDTEGLLLVATKPEFASFVGRLLQDKTRSHTQPPVVSPKNGTTGSREAAKPPQTTAPPTISYIQKKYRCLVRVRSMQDRDILLNQLSQQLHKSQINDDNGNISTGIIASNETDNEGRVFPLHTDLQPGVLVVHYTDPKAPAPKPFVSQSKEGWHQCVLRILEIGPLLTWISPLKDNNLQEELPSTTKQFVMEVKVELITGRTHQIRGQFAALNMSLVGDPLYHHRDDEIKNKLEEVSWDETRNRGSASSKNSQKHTLALQCCSLLFPKPKWGTHPRTNRPALEPTESANDNVCRFKIEKAWWSDLVAIAEPLDSINI